MSNATFRSDLLVVEESEGCCGSDRLISRTAWVTRPGDTRGDETSEAYDRVVTAMLKGRHGTPFEKGLLTVYVECPAVVWWEWTRHRFSSLDVEDQSFNLESGRYRVLDGEFYVPPAERPLIEPSGFKPMRPKLDEASRADQVFCFEELRDAAVCSWLTYGNLIERGYAREVARLALPFSIYYAGYVSANPRAWLQFFSLRTKSDDAKYQTFPQWEIEQCSLQCERLFELRWPITYKRFVENGRVAP